MSSESTSTAPPLKEIAALPSPSGIVRAWQSTAHPSRPLLATSSSDKSVNIWSLRDFQLLSTITGGHKRSIRTVGWKDYGIKSEQQGNEENEDSESKGSGPSAKITLATGSFDANVGIWEYNNTYNQHSTSDDIKTDLTNQAAEEEWNFTTLLTGPDSEIKSLQFSPAHYSLPLLATSSRDKSVWIWEEVEPEEWETIAVLSEHSGDVKTVAWNPARELLASGSYDDTIRLWKDVEEEGDWVCVGVLEGSGGTVWDLQWEKARDGVVEGEIWEPRLASCSDDLSVRIWRRVLSQSEKARLEQQQVNGNGNTPRLPSIIRPPSSFETWEQEGSLPAVHVRSIYAIGWSKKTGLIVSCGGDGVIAVYREAVDDGEDMAMNDTRQHENGKKTRWEVVATMEAAHIEYEVNHVCWAERWDKKKRREGEEVIVSTGDDGMVRVWEMPEI